MDTVRFARGSELPLPLQLAAVSFLLLVPAAGLWAQPREHRASAEVGYASQEYLGDGLTRATLSNGLTVLVLESHAAPVATVRCFVRNTGSAFEGRYLGTGISHMLEHLVAGGSTEKRSEPEIQRLLDTMGGQTNAFTSNDITGYYIDCPARNVELTIELVAESMQFATIPENEYRREMEVVQRELEMGQADRDRMLYQHMKSLIFTEHPIRHPTIGYLPVVQGVDRKDVIAFYKNRYVPQNMVFVVAGDVQTAAVLEKVEQVFKTFQRTTERGVVLPSEPDQASPRSTRVEMPGQTTHFGIAWPTVMLQHPDLYPLDVASYLLTHGDSSRLGYRLKIEQPLAVSVSGFSYTPGFVKGWFEVDVGSPPGNLGACREAIHEEIARLKDELVSDAELDKVKRQKAAEHVFSQQTIQSQANSLASSFYSTGDPQFDEQYVAGIQKVTPEQIRAVARKYFLAERVNTVTIEPVGTGSSAADKTTEVAESPPVIRKQLDNGLTVLLKRHSAAPVVSVQAFVNGGVLSDTHAKSGRASLASQLMMRGTEKYSAREILEYFDSIGGALTMNSQRNSSYLSCQVLEGDFDTALDYAHQVLFHPVLPPDEMENLRQQQLARIAARQANPQTEILDFWAKHLPDTSPYSRTVLGTVESVKQLTLEDCREFHRRFFTPQNMVLSIFGDIDPEKVLRQVQDLFGNVPSGGKPELPEFPMFHSDVHQGRFHLATERPNTAMIIVSYPTVNIKDVKHRAAIEVLNAVLTGGRGAGGRLFNELRGAGLVYYVFGIELTGPAPGFLLMMAQTRPETLEEVQSRIEASIEKLGREGLPPDVLELARQKLIAAHLQDNTTPASQGLQAALDELYGLGYNFDATYDERISQVTNEDIREVVKLFLQHPLVVTSSPDGP